MIDSIKAKSLVGVISNGSWTSPNGYMKIDTRPWVGSVRYLGTCHMNCHMAFFVQSFINSEMVKDACLPFKGCFSDL